MSSHRSTDENPKDGSEKFSDTPSIALLTQKLGTSPAPRMLTPSEFALLTKCAEEVAQVTQEVLNLSDTPSKN